MRMLYVESIERDICISFAALVNRRAEGLKVNVFDHIHLGIERQFFDFYFLA
jgi:hypothetical protein